MHKYLVKGKVSDDDNDDVSELEDKEVEWLIADDDNPQKLRQLQINLLKIFELLQSSQVRFCSLSIQGLHSLTHICIQWMNGNLITKNKKERHKYTTCVCLRAFFWDHSSLSFLTHTHMHILFQLLLAVCECEYLYTHTRR